MKTIITLILGIAVTLQLKAQLAPWPFEHDKDAQSILLLGDNNFQYREKPEEAFKYLMPTLDAADFRFLNLEGPFAGGTDNPEISDIPHKNWRHSNPDQVLPSRQQR
ncbi:MAG: hypothetical protein HC896_09180 [Bacteroidales bacterium]|nr:hypothetical protein [Bacteroidales bacterium]